MPRRVPLVALVLLALPLLLLFLMGSAASNDEIQSVFVTNFPSPQRVAGSVSVEGTIRHASQRRFADLTVPPVNPSETSRLISAGVLEADGFTAVVLALNGASKGRGLKPGVVGALLLPDEESVLRAFEEEGKWEFPLEIKTAAFAGTSPYVSSDAQRFEVGFPRYRVWLYNTSDRTVSVNLYAYLAN